MSHPSPLPAARRRVPVRALDARHRPRLLVHLLALGERDRHLRFGHVASDAQIGRYVDRIDFEHDEVFGIFNRRLEVVAMAHLAFVGAGEHRPKAAEFGVSVHERGRGNGWGTRLFDRAVLHARNRGVGTLIVHALRENGAMLHIAHRAGATLETDGPDATARLRLPPEDLASHVDVLVDQQLAEFDYGLKLQSHRVGAWLQMLVHAAAPDPGAPCPGVITQARDSEAAPPV